MFKRGSFVQLTSTHSRKARTAHVRDAVVLADSFVREGVEVCPIGFFSQKYGAWAQVVPTSDLVEGDAAPPAESPLPRSYRPEYRIWMSMRRRCSDPRNQGFYLYGNRARVCEAWDKSFDQFFADVGPRPSPKHSLDRIDNNGDYEPRNVRWATPKEQARNTSATRFLTVEGVTKPFTQWAEEAGITVQSLEYRLKNEWAPKVAVSRPPQKSVPHRDSLTTKRKRGSGHHRSKLTDGDVLQIRASFKEGEAQVLLAQRFNVSPGTIAYIVHNRTWKHLLPKE